MTDAQVEPDIVESCRWDMRYARGHVPVTLAKAADEIERLRAALAAAQAGAPSEVEKEKRRIEDKTNDKWARENETPPARHREDHRPPDRRR